MFTITAYKVVFFMRRFWFRQSATNRYQSIPIYLSIGIDNRYQSITTRIFAIDWSLIININPLIDIDWYRLISIVIDYRFHRLDTVTRGLIQPIRFCNFIAWLSKMADSNKVEWKIPTVNIKNRLVSPYQAAMRCTFKICWH